METWSEIVYYAKIECPYCPTTETIGPDEELNAEAAFRGLGWRRVAGQGERWACPECVGKVTRERKEAK